MASSQSKAQQKHHQPDCRPLNCEPINRAPQLPTTEHPEPTVVTPAGQLEWQQHLNAEETSTQQQ